MASAELPRCTELRRNETTDVCVIGAGIAGLTTAYLLAKDGARVMVLENRHLAAGQTQRTTAHLVNAHDDLYSEVEKVHGVQGTRIAAQSHTAAIDLIEQIVRDEEIDCDFARLPGYLFCPPGTSSELIDTEMGAAQRAGISGLEIVGRAPITSFDTGRCLRYPQQGQIHPLKYLAQLSNAIQNLGGVIHTGTPVHKIEGGQVVTIETSSGPVVKADAVVVATNTPINDMYAMHTKMAPYLTYAIAARIPRGSVTRALFWDTERPYHYIRTEPLSDTEDLLIIGGEDHKAGQVADQTDRHGRLDSWARERFSMMGSVEYRWSGMVMETTDGAAFIGRNPGDKDNVYIATGDSGMGMTHGTIAGILLRDLILGRPNDWEKFYDPSRKPAAGMAWRKFVSENVNAGLELVKDWLSLGDKPGVKELRPDEGTIERRNLSLVAVYKDKAGKTHECSAVCPHLGCVVHWNNLEKVWDCPCHGSRFDANGQVVNGPAISPLAPVEAKAQ